MEKRQINSNKELALRRFGFATGFFIIIHRPLSDCQDKELMLQCEKVKLGEGKLGQRSIQNMERKV